MSIEKSIFTLTILTFLILIPPAYPRDSLRRSPIVIAVEKVSPAVVNVSTVVKEQAGGDFFRDFFPELFSREYTHTSLGSGVIIDGTNGYIITNHHVVARATEIKVLTAAQEEFQPKLLGSDPRSDLAVLQVETKGRLPEIAMGNSDGLMIGETVIAIGNPFGLSHTVTTGVVSALDRSVRTDEQIYRHFIQTDASINPGNSGGPLLTVEGELIGINTAIYQKAQGIGFAIPINKVKRIIPELVRWGEVRFPWLGLEIQALTDDLKAHFGLPGRREGVLVAEVIEGGPGMNTGIRRGDILLKIEGMGISSPSDYRDILSEFTPSDYLHLTTCRKGEEKRIVIQPGVFPPELALKLVDQRLGIKAGEINEATRNRYGLKGGVYIENVRSGSEAERIGLKSGDLILKINKTSITGLDEFKRAVGLYHHLPSITIVVQRGHYAYSLTLPF